MTGIDTNVLVRYITQDGDEAVLATDFLETEISEQTPGFICLVVLCELVWVLQRAYRYDRKSACQILEKLLSARELKIERADIAWDALKQFEAGSADFSDYIIGRLHEVEGAATTVTFDRKASNSRGFTLLVAQPK